MSDHDELEPGEGTAEPIGEFFANARGWPLGSAPEALSATVRDRVHRARRRRGVATSCAVFAVVAAIALTAGFGFGGKQAGNRGEAVASSSPVPSSIAPSSPTSSNGSTTSGSAPSSPVPSNSTLASIPPLQAVQIDAPQVSLPQNVASISIPTTLVDGRAFKLSALVNLHEGVGVARPPAAAAFGPYALVAIDLKTRRVVNTFVTGNDADVGTGGPNRGAAFVAPDGVNADWVSWAAGIEGDDGTLSTITIHAENLGSGRQLILGTAALGDTSDTPPVVSSASGVGGDVAVWSDSAGLHVYSLAQQRALKVFPVNRQEGWTHFALHWPWLSYTLNGTYDGAGKLVTHPVPHLVDLRDDSDVVASGECDGTWCEVYIDGSPSELTTAEIVSQTDPTNGKSLASNLGRFGNFEAMADGFVLWSDIDPYAPGWGQTPGNPMPDGVQRHDYLYDTASGGNLVIPTLQGFTYISGHYLLIQAVPGDNSIEAIDLNTLR